MKTKAQIQKTPETLPHKDLSTLGSEIAAELAGTWEPMGDCDRGYIALANGMSIFLRANGWNKKGRVTVSPSWPRYSVGDDAGQSWYPGNYGDEKHMHSLSITVALSRGAASIAKDIRSRFLPGFIKAYEYAVKRVSDSDAYTQGKIDRVETLAKVAGPHSRIEYSNYAQQGEPDAVDIRFGDSTDHGHVTLKPSCDGQWTVKGHCRLPQAVVDAICAIASDC